MGCEGLFVTETAQVELKSGRVCIPACCATIFSLTDRPCFISSCSLDCRSTAFSR